jgi:hypothetical protein
VAGEEARRQWQERRRGQAPAASGRAGEENQLRHHHLRLRLVPRQTDQQMGDGLVTEREYRTTGTATRRTRPGASLRLLSRGSRF